ncbi:MAG TPA: hypothetical protein VL494_13825 [Steroidobacteraceae bacterium]|jgi:hypothetical protein|nr:hypothetical protein [Steroidobacteraceae bacterium]
MAITQTPQTALSVSTTELSLLSGTSSLQADTTACVMQAFIDISNMAKGDEFVVKVYETARASGTKRLLFKAVLSDAQSELFCTPPITVVNGWDVTMTKTAGTDRAFDTSVRKVA